MSDLRKAAEMALARLEHTIAYSNEEMAKIDEAKHALRQALSKPVDAVPGFYEPKVSLSRMKSGDRFVLVRTGEIYHIKKDGSQWNETRQRPARLHNNSQVQPFSKPKQKNGDVTCPPCNQDCNEGRDCPARKVQP